MPAGCGRALVIVTKLQWPLELTSQRKPRHGLNSRYSNHGYTPVPSVRRIKPITSHVLPNSLPRVPSGSSGGYFCRDLALDKTLWLESPVSITALQWLHTTLNDCPSARTVTLA